MCRLLGGIGRPRYISEFTRVAFRDSAGKNHPDGWGFAVHAQSLFIFKTIFPIWERPRDIPPGMAFVVHARRGERLGTSLEHVQPHYCEGVVLAHNGGAKISMRYIKDLNLAFRSSSERLACLFGKLVRKRGVENAIELLIKVAKPSPAINFISLIPSERVLVVMNYHTGNRYYTMWKKDQVFSSEPLGGGWTPMSEDGSPLYEVIRY